MSAVTHKPGVEVNIWLPKVEHGNYVSALKGGAKGRVGHASLKIYPQECMKQTYAHLMGNKDHVYASLWPSWVDCRMPYLDFYCGGEFCGEKVQTVLGEEYLTKTARCDVHLESSSFPDAVIRLNRLDIGKMLKELDKVVNTVSWRLIASGASQLQDQQSCSAFCYNLLEIGDIFDKRVYKGTSYGGPSCWKFYCGTNCHLGDICRGIFNSFPWRTLAISPKLVQHIAASAAESDQTDKEDTLALMQSEIVHKVDVHKDQQSSFNMSETTAYQIDQLSETTAYQIGQLDINQLSRQQVEGLLILALFAGGKFRKQAARDLLDKKFGKQNWAQHFTTFVEAIRESLKGTVLKPEITFDALFSGRAKREQAQKDIGVSSVESDKMRKEIIKQQASQFVKEHWDYSEEKCQLFEVRAGKLHDKFLDNVFS